MLHGKVPAVLPEFETVFFADGVFTINIISFYYSLVPLAP
jgi:hypothetical protein